MLYIYFLIQMVDPNCPGMRKNLEQFDVEELQPSITKISLKITYLKFNLNAPGVNELQNEPQKPIALSFF